MLRRKWWSLDCWPVPLQRLDQRQQSVVLHLEGVGARLGRRDGVALAALFGGALRFFWSQLGYYEPTVLERGSKKTTFRLPYVCAESLETWDATVPPIALACGSRLAHRE